MRYNRENQLKSGTPLKSRTARRAKDNFFMEVGCLFTLAFGSSGLLSYSPTRAEKGVKR